MCYNYFNKNRYITVPQACPFIIRITQRSFIKTATSKWIRINKINEMLCHRENDLLTRINKQSV